MSEPIAPVPSQPPSNPNAEKGAQLVKLSRILLLAGLFVMFGGCGVGIAAKTPLLMGVGAGLGFLVIVGAAIVGQVGRAFQGRVI